MIPSVEQEHPALWLLYAIAVVVGCALTAVLWNTDGNGPTGDAANTSMSSASIKENGMRRPTSHQLSKTYI